MKKPEISVIMPFYNAANFLNAAIESILNQTFSAFELIIINDASKDNSEEVVKKYLNDKRIKYYVNRDRKGIAYNENMGISKASCDIIARMDGDDVSHPDRFALQFQYLTEHPELSIVGSFARLIDEKNSQIGYLDFPCGANRISSTYFYHYPFLQGASMYRKKDVVNIGGYREKYTLIDDVDMLLRLMMSGKKGDNIPQYLVDYRKHTASCDRSSFGNRRNLMFKSRLNCLSTYRPKNSLPMYLFTLSMFILELIINSNQKNQLFHFAKKHFSFFQ